MTNPTLSPKQEETAATIFKLTNKYNFPPTLDEIAASMGITKGTLQYHMTALRKKQVVDWNTGAARSVRVVDSFWLDQFESKFTSKSKVKVTIDNQANNFKSEENFVVDEVNSVKSRIPILGKIAAGSPLTVMDKPDDYLELDSYFPDGCYALKVKGESMVDALISDGDLVLIEPRDSAHNGEIVVALLNDEATTLKRFFREKNEDIRLQPENPLMDPIMVSKKDSLKIQGIVKGVIRKI